MDTLKLIRKVVTDNNFQIVDDNDEQISIKYQMNSVHIWPNDDDDHFVVMAITGLTDVTQENFAEIITKCHKLNMELNQVKFYTLKDTLVLSCEIYFMEEKDLDFQIKKGLGNLAIAKGRFKSSYV